eukprot:736287_1
MTRIYIPSGLAHTSGASIDSIHDHGMIQITKHAFGIGVIEHMKEPMNASSVHFSRKVSGKMMAASSPSTADIDTVHVGVIGDLFLDIQANGLQKLPNYDEDNLVDSISFIPGGSAANSARQLAVFPNLSCNVLTTVGNDSLCDTLLNYVRDEPCNFDYIKKIDNVSTASCIVLCAANTGDRGYVTCNGSLNKLTHHVLIENEESLIKKLSHLHIGGFFNTMSLHNDAFIDTLRGFKDKYKTLTYSLDSNSISNDTDPTPYFMKLLPLLDVLFLNKSELIHILTLVYKNMDKEYDTNGDIANSMNDLIAIGKIKDNALNIVVKMGKDGSLVRLGDGTIIKCENNGIKLQMFHQNDDENEEAKYDDLNVIDSTGAGDCFNAGFLGQWLMQNKNRIRNNQQMEQKYFDCLLCGNACGAIRCTMIGGCSKPIPYKEIQKFMQGLQQQFDQNVSNK